jgi:hypothetical protein
VDLLEYQLSRRRNPFEKNLEDRNRSERGSLRLLLSKADDTSTSVPRSKYDTFVVRPSLLLLHEGSQELWGAVSSGLSLKAGASISSFGHHYPFCSLEATDSIVRSHEAAMLKRNFHQSFSLP